MSVSRAYDIASEGKSRMPALAVRRTSKPGLGSGLAFLFAFLFVGLCAWAWANNDSIVAWSLSQGLVGEAATRTLPGAVKDAAAVGGILGAAAAGLALRPVRVAVSTALGYTGLGIAIALRPLWHSAHRIARLVALVLRHAYLGVTVVAQAAAPLLTHVWLVVTAIAGYIQLGVTGIARLVALVLRHAYLGVTIVAQAAAPLLTHVWLVVTAIAGYIRLGVAGIARLVALVLRRAYLGVTIVAQAAAPLLTHVWLVVTAIAGYIRLGLAAVASASGLTLGNAWRVVEAISGYIRLGVAAVARGIRLAPVYLLRGIVVAQAAAPLLRHVWLGLIAIAGYTRLGVAAVARASGLTLAYAWRVVEAVSGYIRLGVAAVARGIRLAPVYLLGGIVVVLYLLWLGVLRYLWTGVDIAARAIGIALAHVWVAIATVLGHVWTGVANIARAIGVVLRYAALGVGIVARAVGVALRYTGRGVAIVARAIGIALAQVWVAVATVLGHVWIGVDIVGRAVGVALRYTGRGVAIAARGTGASLANVWVAIATVLGHVWTGVAIVARAVGVALALVAATGAQGASQVLRYGRAVTAAAIRTVWPMVLAPLALLWTGTKVVVYHGALAIATASEAAVRVIGQAWAVLAAAVVYIWRGVRTLLDYLAVVASAMFRPLGGAAMWTLGQLGRGLYLILLALVRSPRLAVRTPGTAVAVVPGVLRAGLWLVRNRKGVSAMPDNQVKREGLVSLVVTLLVLFTIVAVGVRIFWPAAPEPTVVVVHWTTGHLTRDGLLKEMAIEFNKAGHRSGSGTKIVVEVYDAPSELQGEFLIELLNNGTRLDLNKITNGYVVKDIPDPTIVTPSSAHWLVRVNYEVGRTVVDPDAAKSIVRPVIGIVTYEEMARCLGWPQKQIGFADIIALKNDPLGWGKYPDCARSEWGVEPLLAFTDPKTSSTGRSLHLALYSIAANKSPEDLTIDDVNNLEVEAYVKGFQRLIDHYLIGTTVLNTKIYQGTRYGHFFIMPEDNLIHLYEGTEKSYLNGIKTTAPPIVERMVMIYPKEGSMPRKNCACIVQAEWVSGEQVEASRQWIEFIREDEQQRTFMAAGFRPGTDIDLNYPGSKISSRFGLDPDEPQVVLNPSETPPEVAAAIDSNWEQVKKPGIVTFVVDTSGSMMGAKLSKAKDGLKRAFDSMAKNNQVGFLSFDDTIHNRIPVGLLKTNRYDLQDAVHEMRARGETALYAAIKAGIEMTAAAPGEEGATRAVVVLTDGLANVCQTRLDDIIEMGSRFEAPIVSFSGCQGAPPARDNQARSVKTEELFGTGLAIEPPNPVQVFFIGIGDADLNIGRLLSEATGAEYQGATEKDLANVLEEFSGYF